VPRPYAGNCARWDEVHEGSRNTLRAACGRVIAPARTPLGDSLAVKLPALTRASLVRIQVPQPIHPVSWYWVRDSSRHPRISLQSGRYFERRRPPPIHRRQGRGGRFSTIGRRFSCGVSLCARKSQLLIWTPGGSVMIEPLRPGPYAPVYPRAKRDRAWSLPRLGLP
jgi:hypothetical protein